MKEGQTDIMMGMQSIEEDGRENTLDMLESGQKQKETDSQVTLKFQNENDANEISKVIQALAQKLEELNLIEWHKIQLKSGRKGFAIFFPEESWELVDNQKIELKKV